MTLADSESLSKWLCCMQENELVFVNYACVEILVFQHHYIRMISAQSDWLKDFHSFSFILKISAKPRVENC